LIQVEMGGKILKTEAPSAENWNLEVIAPNDLPAGNYSVTVSFLSQDISYPDERVSLEITLIGTSEVTLEDAIAVRDQELILSGRLRDHLGDPIGNGPITLEWRGSHLADLITELDGSFEHIFTVPMAEALGVIDIGALFGGNAFHTASSDNATVELSQQPLLTIDSLVPAVLFVNDRFTVNGTFTADNGSDMDDTLWFSINGNPMDSFMARDGEFTFDFTIPDLPGWNVGEYDLEVSYKGNSSRWALSVEDDTTFELMKEVHLTFEGDQVHRGDRISLTGTVKDELGHALAGLELDAKWGDNVLAQSVITDSNGLFTFPYTVPNAQLLGPVTATITFDNATDPYYVASQVQALFMVVSELTIDPRGGKVYRNSTISLSGTVVDDQGDSPDQELQFNVFWDGEYLDRVTADTSGDFSLDHFLPVDHPLGSHQLRVNFTGFGWYLPAEGDSNFFVWANTTTTLTEWETPVIVGDKLTLAGTIYNDREQGLDGNVTLRWDGGFRALVPLVAGQFTTTLTIPNTEFAAEHTLQARWPTGNYLEGSNDIVTIVVQRPTNLSADPGVTTRDSTIALTGHLKDHLGLRVTDQTIRVFWDGLEVGNTTTDGNGDWTLPYYLPANETLGIHNVTANFEGSTYHLASDAGGRWELWTITELFYSGQEIDRVNNFTINVRLVDDQDVGLAFRNVTFYWPGMDSVNLTTDNEGSARYVMNLPDYHPLGALSVGLNFTGEPYHHPSTSTAFYDIWANTSIILTMDDTAMAGSDVPFNGTFTDDVGNPMSDLLKIYVNGKQTYADPVTNGTFNGNYYIAPKNISAIYPVEVVYLGNEIEFYRGTTADLNLTVRHNSRLTLDQATGLLNESLVVNGTMLDEADNPINEAQLELLEFTWDGDPITVDLTNNGNGDFSVELLFPTEDVGIHTLNVSFNGDTFFNPSAADALVTLRGRTILTLEVPEVVGERVLFTSTVTLSLEDGRPVGDARILVWLPPTEEKPNGTNRLLKTDENGTVSFSTTYTGTYTSDNSQPMLLKVSYPGDNYHLDTSTEQNIAAIAPAEEEDNRLFIFLGIIGAVVAGGAVLLGQMFRERHLRRVKQVIATTADALERGDDYNATVFESYVNLCRILQHYGYLRKEHETAREFAQALEAALPIDHEPLQKLTHLYERVDYSEHRVEIIDRDEAIASLRSVETSLSVWSEAPATAQ